MSPPSSPQPVNCLSKVLLLFADPKRMSNRAVEVCVTLFALYIIVELNNTPAGERSSLEQLCSIPPVACLRILTARPFAR